MERRRFADQEIGLRDGWPKVRKLIIGVSWVRDAGLGLGVGNGGVSVLEIGIEIHGCY